MAMVESKAECISRIVKLIDAVHRVSEMLGGKDQTLSPPAFQGWAEKNRIEVERFEFELRTELNRLGAEWPGLRYDSLPDLKVRLEKTLELYQSALNSANPAHTRAMLMRQFLEVQRMYDEFALLGCAA
jgi:hypothetical protein